MRQLEHGEVKNSTRRYPISILCADWTDPRNVGSMFRLADAAGLDRLVLAGSTPRPPHAKIDKTARATVRSVDWEEVDEDVVGWLRQQKIAGSYILALEVTDRSENLLEYELPRPVSSGESPLLLIAGNEAAGVAPELLAQCDGAVALPMYGQNTSMNVAVAVGAAIYLLISKH